MDEWYTVEYAKEPIDDIPIERKEEIVFSFFIKINKETVIVAIGDIAAVEVSPRKFIKTLEHRGIPVGSALFEKHEDGYQEQDNVLNQYYWSDIKKIREKFKEVVEDAKSNE